MMAAMKANKSTDEEESTDDRPDGEVQNDADTTSQSNGSFEVINESDSSVTVNNNESSPASKSTEIVEEKDEVSIFAQDDGVSDELKKRADRRRRRRCEEEEEEFDIFANLSKKTAADENNNDVTKTNRLTNGHADNKIDDSEKIVEENNTTTPIEVQKIDEEVATKNVAVVESPNNITTTATTTNTTNVNDSGSVAEENRHIPEQPRSPIILRRMSESPTNRDEAKRLLSSCLSQRVKSRSPSPQRARNTPSPQLSSERSTPSPQPVSTPERNTPSPRLDSPEPKRDAPSPQLPVISESLPVRNLPSRPKQASSVETFSSDKPLEESPAPQKRINSQQFSQVEISSEDVILRKEENNQQVETIAESSSDDKPRSPSPSSVLEKESSVTGEKTSHTSLPSNPVPSTKPTTLSLEERRAARRARSSKSPDGTASDVATEDEPVTRIRNRSSRSPEPKEKSKEDATEEKPTIEENERTCSEPKSTSSGSADSSKRTRSPGEKESVADTKIQSRTRSPSSPLSQRRFPPTEKSSRSRSPSSPPPTATKPKQSGLTGKISALKKSLSSPKSPRKQTKSPERSPKLTSPSSPVAQRKAFFNERTDSPENTLSTSSKSPPPVVSRKPTKNEAPSVKPKPSNKTDQNKENETKKQKPPVILPKTRNTEKVVEKENLKRGDVSESNKGDEKQDSDKKSDRTSNQRDAFTKRSASVSDRVGNTSTKSKMSASPSRDKKGLFSKWQNRVESPEMKRKNESKESDHKSFGPAKRVVSARRAPFNKETSQERSTDSDGSNSDLKKENSPLPVTSRFSRNSSVRASLNENNLFTTRKRLVNKPSGIAVTSGNVKNRMAIFAKFQQQ